MVQCQLCEKEDPDMSLLLAHHKKLGNIYVCRDCWMTLYSENRMVTSGTASCGPCGSSGTCGSCSR
ncbi:MAG: hypothetical protein ACTSRS_00725 [Candidatus Helarchaeota archaeon]